MSEEPADQDVPAPAVAALRDLILAAESFRVAVAVHYQVGVRETEAISYLRARGPLSPAQLAADLHLTTGTVTNLIDRLERAGLAVRDSHATDRRRTLVRLTPLADQLARATGAWLQQCFDPLDDKDGARRVVETIADQLRRRTRDLETGPTQPRQRRRRSP